MDAPPTPPNIPRDQWQSHPNFPEQVLLLGSHENFLRVSSYLVDRAWSSWSAASSRPPAPELRSLFDRWKRAMKSHERYEEGTLYPFLARRYGTTFDSLEAQHEALGAHDRDVRAAFDDGDPLRFAVALRNHDETLRAHLAAEENAVIPLLLSLERDEFTRFVS